MAAAVCLLVTVIHASWNPGEPVVTYGQGPGGSTRGPGGARIALSDKWLAQLKEGGFNTVWANTPEELDLVAKHGLRAIYFLDPETMKCRNNVDDPASAAQLGERIDRVKNHPALYAYALYDEPPAGDFARLAHMKEWVKRRDPNHASWLNLLPCYANHKQLGVGGSGKDEKMLGFAHDIIASYWEHVRLFGEMFRPEFLSYDHYQFKSNGDAPNYFLNLGIVRQSASAQKIPFWNGLQACTWVPGEAASPRSPRIPEPDEMRYLVYSSAAYGAQGIYYYVYCAYGHRGAIVSVDGKPDAKYEALKTINREFVAIARILSPLNFTGAYFQGLHAPGTTPYCEQALLKIAPETPYAELKPLQELTDTTLVTRFDTPGKPTHLMVVNCDYRKDRTLHIKAPSTAERFDALAGTWSRVGTEFDLSLVRGGGTLLRLTR